MILVTGASGTNGSEIIRQLSNNCTQVKALVRNHKKASLFDSSKVEVAIGDFNQPKTLDTALENVEKILLLSTVASQQVKLQNNLIEAAKRSNVRHIVKFSALGADVNAAATILRWHGQTEKQLEESGIAFTHLKPNVFMQNMFRVAHTIATRGFFYDRVDNARFSFIDVRDIAAVAVKVLLEGKHEGKSYTITGSKSLSFNEVAEILSLTIGKKVTYINISPKDYKKNLLKLKIPEWFIDAANEIYSYYAEGSGQIITNTVAEITKQQPISFNQFAKDYVQKFIKI